MNKFKKLKKICQQCKDLDQNALMQELDFIKEKGLLNDFYALYKKGKTGNENKINSLTAYALGITNKKPAGKFTPNIRFKSARIAPPDIDLDFADHRRGEVIEYVKKKYGKNRVAQIITFGTMAARASIRDAGRALDLPYSFCDQTAKMIPMFTTLGDALENVDELKSLYQSDNQAKKLLNVAKKLEGVARHASTHACGVVITAEPLDSLVPIQYASQKDQSVVTQYEMHAIEDLGLLKMDFLGLKNLTVIENAIFDIEKKYEQSSKSSLRSDCKTKIDLNNIPLKDKKTFELLQKAQTTGVFQLESAGMRRYLKQLRPNEFEDIVAMVSLYRPGPIELIPEFIDKKHGKKEIQYLHPKLEPILKNTYGIAVYQEQVLQIARDLAGFTLGEADVLRKAVGKKIKKLLDEQKDKFIKGCIKNKISKSIARKLFSFIEPFARYGFNRAHATCYAMIGYQTAYLKAHWPEIFMAALLTCDKDNTDRIAIEVSECRDLGIDVLAPGVNESDQNFVAIENKKISFGLSAIKNVGNKVVDVIVSERQKNGKYKSLEDFLERVICKNLNKKSLESLVKCGALDEFGERNRLLYNIELLLLYARNIQKAANVGQASLFGSSQIKAPQLRLEDAKPISKKQQLLWEKELLGLYVSEHPIENLRKYFLRHTIACSDLNIGLVGKPIRIGGIVQKVKKYITKTGKPMMFVQMEDLTGSVDVVVFPRTLKENPNVWQEDKILMIFGKLNNRNKDLSFICESAREIG